tara:strand:+ start:281 stop:454 length:174 start_codon:yes stop_codon:yes gene_type:complete
MTILDSDRAVVLLLSVQRGRDKDTVVRNEDEAAFWDELVGQVAEIEAEGLAVGVPNP